MASTTTTSAASPIDQAEIAHLVRSAYEASQAVCPVGGRTALDYGHSPTQSGRELDLTGLGKTVDYTPRDMTIVVEAGVRMADLAATLAAEGQHLPIDVPRAAEATLGGVVATNWSGARRYGYGTIRDYVIGISAIDGRGVAFKGGGRVVKNVAGYDFCKLLTGSLGTLGVVTQLALKVKPTPERSAAVVAMCVDLSTAEALLGRLVQLPASPTSIDLLVGEDWPGELARGNQSSDRDGRAAILVVRIEGTETEVAKLSEATQYELWSAGGAEVRQLEPAESDALWLRQLEFSARGAGATDDNAPMVIKIAVPPSFVTQIISELVAFDPRCNLQAHAGNGIVVARFSKFTHTDLTTVLVGKFRSAAMSVGGSVVVVSSKLEGLTPHLIWGGRTDATVLMERVKKQFDPRGILNPGRFVF